MERWLPIVGYPHYEVSDQGQVRNLPRTIATVHNQLRRYSGGIIAPSKNQHGHLKVLLIATPGVKTARYVHDLVVEAFIGPRPPGCEIAHNDGSVKNNRVENLRYATPKENAADKRRHGTHRNRANHPRAKLSEEDVAVVHSRLALGHTQRDIANDFGVARATIGAIAIGRSWRGGS